MQLAVEEALRGKHIIWTAPTFSQVEVGWKEMQKACGGAVHFRRNRMEAEFPFDGTVTFRSLDDPDNARGLTGDGAVMDEAGFIQERAWTEVIRPIISDTGGWAFIIGTPKGRNWFWRGHMNAGDLEEHTSFQVPTLGVKVVDGKLIREPHPLENPDFKFTEAEEMFRTMSQKTFEQEFLAQFVDDAGLVFRGVRDVSLLEPQLAPIEGHVYVMGVDWAKTYDWTVLSVWDATTKQQVFIDRFNQIDYLFQLHRLKVVADRYKVSLIIPEANSMGGPLVEALVRFGYMVEPFIPNNNDKANLIEAFALAIERGEVKLLKDEVQMSELEAYDRQKLPSGVYRYSAPQGMHDDTVIAAALGYSGVSKPGAAIVGVDYSRNDYRGPYEITRPSRIWGARSSMTLWRPQR